MSAHREAPDQPASSSPGGFDLLAYLADYLTAPEPKFFMIMGPVGSGKSTLLRSLVLRIPGPKVFLAYSAPSLPTPPGPRQDGSPPIIPILPVYPTGSPPGGGSSSSGVPIPVPPSGGTTGGEE